MSDLTLDNGAEINFDLRAITYKEYLGMFDTREAENSSDITLAKVCHMERDELLAMTFWDYKKILAAFFRKANAPLESPNSQSAST